MKLCRNRESSSVANEVGAKDKNIHPHLVCFQKNISLDVNFCKDHRDIIEVPDPLAVEDLISSKLNNKRKLARLITQYRDIFFQYFGSHGLPSSGCYRE